MEHRLEEQEGLQGIGQSVTRSILNVASRLLHSRGHGGRSSWMLDHEELAPMAKRTV